MAAQLVVLHLITARRPQNAGMGKRGSCTVSEGIRGQHGEKSLMASTVSAAGVPVPFHGQGAACSVTKGMGTVGGT